VVAWESGGAEIRARLFDSLGSPQTDEFSVSTLSSGHAVAPSITATPDGGFYATWMYRPHSSLWYVIKGQAWTFE